MTTIGLLLFPGMTQLDLTGPHAVFSRLPDTTAHLVWRSLDPVVTDSKLVLVPTVTFATCPPLDLLMVPGGPGVEALLSDAEALSFVREAGERARWVTSVCTGALVLGQAGLLEGYAATTHWSHLELLPLLGAEVRTERVVIDRNRITAGGVTAGIDFGLTLAAQLHGEAVARLVQLGLEYDPAPAFDSGHPRSAAPEHVAQLKDRFAARLERQRALILARRR